MQNRSLLAVLLASIVLTGSILAMASLRPGTGPDDVAIRVEGVEVTFAEYELRTAVRAATQRVSERLVEGEDFGMPAEALEQMRMIRTLFGPVEPDLDEDVGLIASAVVPAAAYASALAQGQAPSDVAIAERVQTVVQFEESIRTGDSPRLGFPRAVNEAQRAAIGEERYREEYLPLRARDELARDLLNEHLDLAAAEAGIVPVTMAMRAAEDADLWIHPSFGVTVEEVRTELERGIRFQEALLALSQVWQDGSEG